MLYLSLEKFLHWVPFLLVGFFVYYLASQSFQHYRKNFTLTSNLYFRVADIVVPLNMLVVISLDLYFLINGTSIFLLSPSSFILSLLLSAISFIVGILSFSTYFTVYLMSSTQRLRGFFFILLLAVPVITVLGVLIIFRILLLMSSLPLFMLAIGSILSIPMPKKKFHPSSIISLPFIIIILAASYIIYVLVYFK